MLQQEKSDQIKLIKDDLANFSLEFIKVLLQTGYYSSDHPITNIAITELYNKFRKVLEGSEHLTYMLSSLVEKEDIWIDGIREDSISLTHLLKGSMAEHFIKKLIDYFDRNRFVAFTIKSEIDKVEFHKFLGIIVEWHLWDKEARKRGGFVDSFTESLIRNAIFNVNIIHRDDIIGLERHIPWQVKLALTRLRKNLRLIPLFRQASKEDIRELKKKVTKDVVKPLRKGDFVRDLLFNIDLVVEGASELGDMDIENEIIINVKSEILPQSADSLIRTYKMLKTHEGEEHPSYGFKFGDTTIKRLLKKFSSRLYNEQSLSSQEMFETMFREQILKLEELPERIQKKLKAEILTDQFIKNEITYLKDFEKTANPKSYLKYLKIITIIIVELIRRRKFQIIDRIVTIIENHLNETSSPFVNRTHYINEALNLIKTDEVYLALEEEFVLTKKEFREILAKLFLLLGSDSIPHFLKMLFKVEDVGIRRELCELIEKFGEAAKPFIEDELRSHRHTWFTIRNLIFILGNIGNKESAKYITPYFAHHHPKVKEECIEAVFKLLGNEGEVYFLHCLKDPDEGVRRAAVRQLGAIKSLSSTFFNFLRESIRKKKKGEKEVETSIQIACLRAFIEYEAVTLPDQTIIEKILVDAVKKTNIFDYIRGEYKYQEKELSVRAAIAETLGHIASGKAEDVLVKLLRDKDDAVKKAARKGLDMLRERMTKQIVKKGVQYYSR